MVPPISGARPISRSAIWVPEVLALAVLAGLWGLFLLAWLEPPRPSTPPRAVCGRVMHEAPRRSRTSPPTGRLQSSAEQAFSLRFCASWRGYGEPTSRGSLVRGQAEVLGCLNKGEPD